MCIPGICTARARHDERRRKEGEERAQAQNKRKRKAQKERKREMKLARTEGRELLHRDQPARFVTVNGPRWPTNRSKTEVNGDGSHDQGAILICISFPKRTPI
jgi:sRNA-binding protein